MSFLFLFIPLKLVFLKDAVAFLDDISFFLFDGLLEGCILAEGSLFQGLNFVPSDFQLLCIVFTQLIKLDCHWADSFESIFHSFSDFRNEVANRWDLMSSVSSMNDAFWADQSRIARETNVWKFILRMLITRVVRCLLFVFACIITLCDSLLFLPCDSFLYAEFDTSFQQNFWLVLITWTIHWSFNGWADMLNGFRIEIGLISADDTFYYSLSGW